ncbi:hypothetical protein QTN25_008839 [Entamoeba marina]
MLNTSSCINDVDSLYTGQKMFNSLDDALVYLTKWADERNIKLRKREKVVLVCQCSGKIKQGHDIDKKKRVVKTGCPFRINLNYRDKQQTWFITKMNINHNHPLRTAPTNFCDIF